MLGRQLERKATGKFRKQTNGKNRIALGVLQTAKKKTKSSRHRAQNLHTKKLQKQIVTAGPFLLLSKAGMMARRAALLLVFKLISSPTVGFLESFPSTGTTNNTVGRATGRKKYSS